MEESGLKKIVYEDDGKTKVLRGTILKEDEFTYLVQALKTNAIITIGKRAVIKVDSVEGEFS